jgi:hypothetical protein
MEELSIRANIALSQKRVIQEIKMGGDDDDFQQNYHALSAQVVSTLSLFVLQFVS